MMEMRAPAYIFLCVVTVLLVTSCSVAASRQLIDVARFRAQEVRYRSEDILEKLFEEWMDRHARSYRDIIEESSRYVIFKDNLRRIDEHNRTPSSYKLGLTKFADLTHEEFKDLYLKTKHRRHVRLHQASTFSYANVEVLPRTMDWRKQRAVTGVKDQGPCGSSWAFSTIGAVEGVNMIKAGKLISLSEQELIDCDFTQRTQGCQGGYLDYGYAFLIQNGGINSENAYPYSAGADMCDYHKTKKFAATITCYEDVPANSEIDLQRVVAHQPVSVAIRVDEGDFQLYTSGIYDGDCGTELNHALVAVGYGSEQGEDYWILKNSWGESWGEDGYLRIQRNIDADEGKCGIAMMASYPMISRDYSG